VLWGWHWLKWQFDDDISIKLQHIIGLRNWASTDIVLQWLIFFSTAVSLFEERIKQDAENNGEGKPIQYKFSKTEKRL
jgi:hypothetical protein